MSNFAISIRNLAKAYQIKDSSISSNQDTRFAEQGKFYALKNINLDIKQGEVVALIGGNGSGKSTLLKILSGITKPSAGEARITGNVASILDVGSNFHPDLTGIENVKMNLSLKGVPNSEHKKMLGLIETLSDIGDFINQPVKYYSNGMFLRLSFAVAFHTFGDIFLLDEVMNIGDIDFRLKSFELIKQLSQAGKTIILATHDTNDFFDYCNSCIWLNKGELKMHDTPANVLSNYYDSQLQIFESHNTQPVNNNERLYDETGIVEKKWHAEGPGNAMLKLKQLSIKPASGRAEITRADDIYITVEFEKLIKGVALNLLISLSNAYGQPSLIAPSVDNLAQIDYTNIYKQDTGLFSLRCVIPKNLLAPGDYHLSLNFGINSKAGIAHTPEGFRYKNKIKFSVKQATGQFDFVGNTFSTAIRPRLSWEYSKLS